MNVERLLARAEEALPQLAGVLAENGRSGQDGAATTALALADEELPDDPEMFFERLVALGISDGLPAIPPTKGRVERMLAGLDPKAAVARVPPRNAVVTIEMIAVCGVMAGCLPGHLPILLACVRALEHPALNAQGLLTTTGTATLATIVNGPIRTELGFNSGTNCLGPGNRNNATVGRALSLITRMLGGAEVGVNSMPTMGQPGRYAFCFAENEEDNPWEPLHVERGFERAQSTVTLIGVSGTQEVTNGYARSPQELLQLMAQTMAGPGTIRPVGASSGGGQPLVLFSPEWGAIFAANNLSKNDVRQYLFERAVFRLEDLPAGMLEEIRHSRPNQQDTVLKVAAAPQDILIVVAGGVGIKQTYVPNWIGVSKAVTVPIGER